MIHITKESLYMDYQQLQQYQQNEQPPLTSIEHKRRP